MSNKTDCPGCNQLLDEIKQLQEKADGSKVTKYMAEAITLENQVRRLQKEKADLMEALDWYKDAGTDDWLDDRGQIAREVLDRIKAKEGE